MKQYIVQLSPLYIPYLGDCLMQDIYYWLTKSII